MSDLTTVRALRPLLGTYRARLAGLVCVGAVAGLAEGLGLSLFLPLLQSLDAKEGAEVGGLLGRALRRIFATFEPSQRHYVILGAMFALMALKAAANAVNGLLFARLDARVVDDLRRRALDRSLRARLGFVESKPAGELVALILHQTWEVSGALATFVGIAIRLVTVAVFGLALVLISWQLTLAVAAALLVISWIVRRIGRSVDRLGEVGLERWNDLSHRTLEVVRGQRTTRAFGAEARELERYGELSARTSHAYWRVERLRALIDPLSELMVAGLLSGVLVLSIGDPARIPTVLTFTFILFRLQPQVQRLDAARVKLAAATAPVRSVTGFLANASGAEIVSGTHPFTALRRSIRFEGVDFRYDARAEHALRAVDATIPAGRTTAIVGPSGAGKSTLIHLLLRFADPSAGTILIDHVPLTDLNLATWRAGIAVVGQDAHVFDGSIADNVRYGRPEATDAEVRAAARRAHADAFIEALPNGYATRLGEDGLQLSGGQRQRIALARAILRDAHILVLDEATNALDAIAESVVRAALDEIGAGRTVLVIAHRMATVERADHVVVLDQGRVVEAGSPDALLADAGLFARLHGLSTGTTR